VPFKAGKNNKVGTAVRVFGFFITGFSLPLVAVAWQQYVLLSAILALLTFKTEVNGNFSPLRVADTFTNEYVRFSRMGLCVFVCPNVHCQPLSAVSTLLLVWLT